MDRPETRFVWRDESALAYQVLGEGEPALLYLQGWVSNVELNWDHPTMARFLRGLARSRRLVVTDPRGMGCSERCAPHDVWPIETIMDDLTAVLDAAGVERAAILATHELGLAATMFAATYPERTSALALYRTMANGLWSEETPWEWTEEQWLRQEQVTLRLWGTRAHAEDEVAALGAAGGDRSYLDWWHRYMLLSQAPGVAVAAARKYTHVDIRKILPSIPVPTLVLRRPGADEDPSWGPSGRYLAEHIPGARLVDLPGRDAYLWVGEPEAVLGAIDDFLGAVGLEASDLERVLATVLFVDVVGSTEKAASIGDGAWRDLVERHRTSVRSLLDRFRGREVDTAGDGFFATFDGPARAIRCAQAIVEDVQRIGLEVRAGLHTGECETIDGKVGGIAVNIGARVGALAEPSEVLVSQTVKDLVAGSSIVFADRGDHDLKGIADRWRLYRVVSG